MSTIAKLTLADYDRMVESGIFDGPNHRRVELIHGELREMSPIGSRHDAVVQKLARWSISHLSEDVAGVRIQGAIGIPEFDSVPQPDIAWLAPEEYWEERPQPRDVYLIIEVAESSLVYDRGEKAELYAAAGIAEYWIVDIPEQCVEVYRQPQQGRYRSLQTFNKGETINPLQFPNVVLKVETLFPPE